MFVKAVLKSSFRLAYVLFIVTTSAVYHVNEIFSQCSQGSGLVFPVGKNV